MTNFELGEVQTDFHTVRVRVSTKQVQVKKLQEEDHVEQTMQLPGTVHLQTKGIEVGIQPSAFP